MGNIWSGLLAGIFWLLQFFYGWVHDWGFAIILLTIAFRVLLIPLTWRQTKSMYELQAIQPKLQALQAKYKNDKEKQNEELMKFYQENKVNPFGGCLPLLLQMPLFIALFSVLRDNLAVFIAKLPIAEQAAARHFSVFLPDITMTPQQVYTVASSAVTRTVGAAGASVVTTSAIQPGGSVTAGVVAVLPYILLVALFGLSTWLPQFLMSKDPTQRRTGTYMAIVMLWFGFVSPAGVLLYWVTSSAWQIGQQMITQRAVDRAKQTREAEEAAAKAAADAEKAAARASRQSAGRKLKKK